MIAVARSGRRFAGLTRYLERGRDGTNPDRVAWTTTRNLIVDEPLVAARVMQATAAENARVTHPVYHVAVSFHPDDVVDRQTMERVADYLLRELGLAGHQTLIVAHRDRSHAHMHIVVNRIHPETGKAWDRWQDRVTTQRVLREEERALGLREVRGRLHQLPGQDVPERTAASRGEHRTTERTGEAPLVARLRERLPYYRAAGTWGELETRLAANGLRLERKGQGLVITDGEHEVKASRIGRDFSFARLQERLGPYERRTPERPVVAPAGPHTGMGTEHAMSLPDPVAEALSRTRGAERAAELDRAIARAKHDAEAAEKYLAGVTWAEARATAAAAEFDRALGKLYVRPDDARELFDSAVKASGRDAAARDLAENPRAYGPLRRQERTIIGVLRVADDRRGEARAAQAARAGRDAALAADRLRARIWNAPPAMPRPNETCTNAHVHALTHGASRLRWAERRRTSLKSKRMEFASAATLGHQLAHVARVLTPSDLRRATLWLTAPQMALVNSANSIIRQIAIGR